ncbi:hypothetical protein [Streptomyces sp. NPDC051310]|uniref:hypothetical protein n=1 Tax=Streptomyces sp. NPDC051310 TaxID=3365649 RepID=UPI00378E91D7
MTAKWLGRAAVALCVGGALTACGSGGDGEGRAAVGAVGSRPDGAPAGPVPPSGEVVLVPLDGTAAPDRRSRAGPDAGRAPGTRTEPGAGAGTPAAGAARGGVTPPGPSGTGSGSGAGKAPATPAGPGSGAPAPGRPAPGTPSPGTPAPTTPPADRPPPAPAALAVGGHVRTPTDRRWCERVTVEFRNTGGSPVRSGTVTFGTHIVGALGVDWATITSTRPLPAPIPAGATKRGTYTVCVDAWRVPLGMHIDTRDVTAADAHGSRR